MMKKPILIMMLLITALWTACSDSDDDGDTQTQAKLSLSSDKQTMLADGKDVVVFTVKDEKGIDCTNDCQFLVNGTKQEAAQFITNQAGTYKVVATFNGITSNEVRVVAVGENVNLKIAGNKGTLLSDGGDLARLSLLDENENDVTDLGGVFYADGNKIEGRCFKTKVAGMHKITATWNGKTVSHSINIGAFDNVTLLNRVLVESFTGTDCQYCPAALRILDPLVKENSQVILVELHKRGTLKPVSSTEAYKDMTELVGYYGVTGTPQVFINRQKTIWRAEKGKEGIIRQIKSKNEVAIAIETVLKEGKVEIDATLSAVKDFTGKVAAVLIENDIIANMYDMGEWKMPCVLRDYVPGITGKDVTLKSGELSHFITDIPMNADWVTENCQVIVYVADSDGFVVQAQRTDVGSSIGY